MTTMKRMKFLFVLRDHLILTHNREVDGEVVAEGDRDTEEARLIEEDTVAVVVAVYQLVLY